MHNTLTDYLDYWDNNIERLGKLIRSKYNLEDEMPFSHKGVVSIYSVVIFWKLER